MEDAYWCGRAWSLFLPGTDDFHISVDLAGESIPALAHKVIMNWDDELMCYVEAVRRSVERGYKAVSIVIDTVSSKKFIEEYLFFSIFCRCL
jgi:nicotinamide phosphoribosyltransferase